MKSFPHDLSSKPYSVPGLTISDHWEEVPLDYSGTVFPDRTLQVFYRVITSSLKEACRLPYLLYLQGGPGFECPRPTTNAGFLKVATNSFRVVFMDQRGTGLSDGISTDSLMLMGDTLHQMRYLQCFRADSIVKDAEAIRKRLGSNEGRPEKKWAILGQSFGGFCATTYLSLAPEGLMEVYMTGGIPPGIDFSCAAENVYKETFEQVRIQNKKYYGRFPMDIKRAQNIVSFLESQPNGYIETPLGNRLTPRSFQSVGMHCLGFAQGFERLHYMLEGAFMKDGSCLSRKFLKDFDSIHSWDTNPLYALLHESVYCQNGGASLWSAHRVLQNDPCLSREFDAVTAAKTGKPVYFTGEMIFPWMFEDFKVLRNYKDVAELLARNDVWPDLYSREVLQINQVPVSAAVYVEDMFVSYELSRQTASDIKGLRMYITNEWLHDGLREAGGKILERLFNMAKGLVPLR